MSTRTAARRSASALAAPVLATVLATATACGDAQDTTAAAAGRLAASDREPGAALADSPTGQPWLVDVTAAAGLAFEHAEGDEQWDIRPTMGPGAGFLDADGDGDEDLLVVGGKDQTSRLFLGDGKGRFIDGTEAWGLGELSGSGMGVVCADWDGDGDQDAYLTFDGPNVLLRNDAGRFSDVTAASGTGDPHWGASAAFGDVDRDGDLDLFVTNYLAFDTSLIPPESDEPSRRREDPIAMLPYVFPAQPDVLYRNDGEGRFSDVSEAAGLRAAPAGKSLGVIFLDQDADGWPDIHVAGDTTPDQLWHNRGDGSFEELALWLGLDDPRGGMGLAAADVDADGDEDILLTNWQIEANALYRNNRLHAPSARRFMPAFEDISVPAGLAQPSIGVVGWGCVLADLDNDGDHDAFVANGYTSPDYETTMQCVGQVNHLFENVTPAGSLREHKNTPRWRLVAGERAGAALAPARAHRGLAAADVDGDLDLDLVVTANNGPLVLLANTTGGASLRVVPRGHGLLPGPGRPFGSNRDGVGAEVTLELADGERRVAVVRAGSGYLGCHERGVRFGLGEQRPVAVNVRWPDGTTSTHPADGPGVLTIDQPAP